jgi:hypothetical protein
MAGAQLGPGTRPSAPLIQWRILQAVVLGAGAFITVALFVAPELGLHLLWNVLIPVAPALLVVAPGFWRNVCPMGTVSLLPRHFGLSKRRVLSVAAQGRLVVGALALLLLIVPLRHVILDTNGPAIGAALVLVALLAAVLGAVFEWKSAWCSGLCPVYPVELLYGQEPVVSVRNAHCRACENCVAPCKDGTPALQPANANASKPAVWAGTLIAGGFPGFIWGWYQVPTWRGYEGFAHLDVAFGLPLAAMLASFAAFMLLRTLLSAAILTRVFAAAAVSIYYWFKLPVMLGFGDPDAALVDVHMLLGAKFALLLPLLATALFFFLLVYRRGGAVWAKKPTVAAS